MNTDNRENEGGGGSPPPMPPSYLTLPVTGLVLAGLLCRYAFGPALLVLLPPGVIAVVFSLQVKRRYRKGDYRGAKIASRVACWCGLLGILLFFAAVMPATTTDCRPRSPNSHSVSNLKQLGLACKIYAMDYDDYLPDRAGSGGLELLRKMDYLADYGCYVMPEHRKTLGGDGVLSEISTSYAYIGAGLKTDGIPGNTPVMFEKPWLIVKRDWINVLSVDGRVDRFSGRFKTCVEVVEFQRADNNPDAPVWRTLLANARKVDRANGR